MSRPSTLNLQALPAIDSLKQLCKSISVLDAVICPEWEYRYYSYQKNWDAAAEEECMTMRNGSGDEFLILFNKEGVVINGFAHESIMSGWKEVPVKPKTFLEKISGKKKTELKQIIWEGVVDTLPDTFKSFIFGEPVKSIGTTFCIWRRHPDSGWQTGNIHFPKDAYGDGSEHLLFILDNKPETYKKWAVDYYEEQFDDDSKKLDIELIRHVYAHKKLTRTIVLNLNPDLEDFEKLKADLDEIGYEYEL